MKRYEKPLTNEALLKNYSSQFELVAEAIAFAKKLVHHQKLPTDCNPTSFILENLSRVDEILNAPKEEIEATGDDGEVAPTDE